MFSVGLMLPNRIDHGVTVGSIRHLALGQEVLENVDAFAVRSHFVRLVILNLGEVGAVLLQNHAWRLFWQSFHLLSDLTCLASENFEFFGLDQVLVLGALADESFQ